MVQVLDIPDVTRDGDTSVTTLRGSPGRLAATELTIEVFPAAAPDDDFLPHWRGLADRALEANPFMAPEFILPAAMHLKQKSPLLLAAIWRKHARSRELTGLFAMTRDQKHGLNWLQPPRMSLWSHSLMAIGIPLISSGPEVAHQTLRTFLTGQLSAPRRVSLPAIPVGGAFDRTLGQVATALDLSAHLASDAAHSRGLDIDLEQEPATEAVQLAQEPATLRIMLEQALAMDAAAPRGAGEATPIIHDSGRLALMRAVVRGFAQTRQIAMAKINHNGCKAAAIAIVSADKAYLWQFFGPSAHDPQAETALICALRAVIGKPVIAAASHPVAGFCTTPLRTRTVSLALT